MIAAVLDQDPYAGLLVSMHGAGIYRGRYGTQPSLKLTFADERDIGLETEWIYLRGGELEIGTEDKPYTRQATITLTDTVPGEDINTMGDRGIMLMGGTLSLHGDREHTWTKLARTAEAGSAKIEVLDASGWRKGDEIVLASTDFDPRQAEKRTVAAVSGNTITLDRPLEYMHFGEITFGVRFRLPEDLGLADRELDVGLRGVRRRNVGLGRAGRGGLDVRHGGLLSCRGATLRFPV